MTSVYTELFILYLMLPVGDGTLETANCQRSNLTFSINVSINMPFLLCIKAQDILLSLIFLIH